jgi:hypothetical protein
MKYSHLAMKPDRTYGDTRATSGDAVPTDPANSGFSTVGPVWAEGFLETDDFMEGYSRQRQAAIMRWTRARVPFSQIESRIDAMADLPEEERAALWLFAWASRSGAQRPRLAAEAATVD